ncbi:MAG: SMC-Scp complex subunit ScpB [Phycisphaerales bacterium]
MQGNEPDAVVEDVAPTTDGGATDVDSPEIEVSADPPPRRGRRRRGAAGKRGSGPAAHEAGGDDDPTNEAAGAADETDGTDQDAAADDAGDVDAKGGSDADAAAAETETESETVEDAGGAAGRAADAPCRYQSLTTLVEALLFSSDRPLTEARMADLVGLTGPKRAARIRGALAELDSACRATGRSFRPRKIAGGWQLLTVPVLGPLMARLHRDRQERRLSPAALETLSIVAYRQPVVRAELEAIRGVACGEVLRSLMEKRLIRVVGRAEELGRPLLYGTTRQFLEVFGLGSLDELPDVVGLERRPSTVLRKDTPAGEAGDSDSPASQPADAAAGATDRGATDASTGASTDASTDDSTDDSTEEAAGTMTDAAATVDGDSAATGASADTGEGDATASLRAADADDASDDDAMAAADSAGPTSTTVTE